MTMQNPFSEGFFFELGRMTADLVSFVVGPAITAASFVLLIYVLLSTKRKLGKGILMPSTQAVIAKEALELISDYDSGMHPEGYPNRVASRALEAMKEVP